MPTADPLDIVYLLAANYPRGGIKMQIEHANRMARRGHQVRILSNVGPPDWIDLLVPWQRVEIPHGSVLGMSLPPCRLVVFSFYEQAYALMGSVLKAGAVPLYFAQGDELLFGDPDTAPDAKTRGYTIAARASARLPFPQLTVSRWAAKRLQDLGGTDITIIHNGIDTKVFHPRPRDGGDPLRLFCVGAEQPKFKGIEDLYAVVMKLKRDAQAPPFTFVRVSPRDNAFAGLPVDVEFHRNPDQIRLAELYAGADLFVAPSHDESFYLTPLEAMASGTPVICSDLPAVREYAQPDRDYLPFPPGDLKAMYAQVVRALTSEELRRRLTIAGLETAHRMSWDTIMESLERYYRSLLERRESILMRIRNEIRRPTVPFSTKQD